MNKDLHNDHEEQPSFHKAGSKHPLKADDDYFNSFSDKMQERVKAFEELRTEAPLLSEIPKYNPFDVPEHYFDELPAVIREHCIQQKKDGWIDKLILLFRPGFVIPSMMVITLFVACFYYFNNPSKESVKTEIAEENTIEEQLQNIDEATILDALTAEVTSENPDTESDHIVDYLIDNNIDETSLNNDL